MHMTKRVSAVFAVTASCFVLDGSVVQAASYVSPWDKPAKVYKKNERVHFQASPLLQKFPEEDYANCGEKGPYYGVCYYYKTLKVTPYRLVYRLDRDPNRAKKGKEWNPKGNGTYIWTWDVINDVRASVQVGRNVYHDGQKWRNVAGAFTTPSTYAGLSMVAPDSGKFCFSKIIALPRDDSRYLPGKQVRMKFRFSRTRQRIWKLSAPITDNATGDVFANQNKDDARVKSQLADIEAMGCPLAASHPDFGGVTGINDPDVFSPMSVYTSKPRK